jgi:effector-binding domain-containing protein
MRRTEAEIVKLRKIYEKRKEKLEELRRQVRVTLAETDEAYRVYVEAYVWQRALKELFEPDGGPEKQ